MRRRRRVESAATYKLCSLLLLYPDEELLGAREELLAAARELPRSRAAAALARFGEWWLAEDELALQQHYVETFDLHKRSGLYVTFYGEGDRRERGSALLRLKRMYRAAGLPLEGGSELPDYLPVMLEFAAAMPGGEGEIVLREHRAAIELLRENLRARGTPYADVLDAVCLTLGDPSAADRARMLKIAAAGPPQELVGLEPFMPPEITAGTEARR
ncbi:MAG TPA: nitrate reductase molybdenum cofactor assembly chaperone [Thermoleophilaceae bacterium]|jgi:nitrate reductase molybdenum cofactor assembly chaperone NarJ/NarW|nr:nitrate reductase molybdenum cofactor assembly chaperone [Thermoleophilaceae bacterium]